MNVPFLARYRWSNDYSKLALLAKEQSTLCVLDHQGCRDIAQALYSECGGLESWSVGVRGTCYLSSFDRVKFMAQCESVNLVFLDDSSSSECTNNALKPKSTYWYLISQVRGNRRVGDFVMSSFSSVCAAPLGDFPLHRAVTALATHFQTREKFGYSTLEFETLTSWTAISEQEYLASNSSETLDLTDALPKIPLLPSEQPTVVSAEKPFWRGVWDAGHQLFKQKSNGSV